jgi:hypothetical protein
MGSAEQVVGTRGAVGVMRKLTAIMVLLFCASCADAQSSYGSGAYSKSPGGYQTSGKPEVRQNLVNNSHDLTGSIGFSRVQQGVGVESPLGGEAQYWVGDPATAGVHYIHTRPTGVTFTEDNVLSLLVKSDGEFPEQVKLSLFNNDGPTKNLQAVFQWDSVEETWAYSSGPLVDDAGAIDKGDGWWRVWVYVDGTDASVVGDDIVGNTLYTYIYVTGDATYDIGNWMDGFQLEQVNGRTSPGKYVAVPEDAHRLEGRNLLENSWDFTDGTYWNTGGPPAHINVAYGALDPFGGTEAFTLSYAGQPWGQIQKQTNIGDLSNYGGYVTASLYARNINSQVHFSWRLNSPTPVDFESRATVYFTDDALEGSTVASVSNKNLTSSGFEYIGDGWSRIWLTTNFTEQGVADRTDWRMKILAMNGNTTEGERIETYGWQVEKGTIPTAYENRPAPYATTTEWTKDAVMRWGTPYDFSAIPALYDTIGTYALYVDGSSDHVFDDDDFDIDLLRAINPDIKLLVYVSAMSQQESFSTAPVGSYNRRLYDLTQAYPAKDINGDQYVQYSDGVGEDKLMWNILEPDAVTEFVQIHVDFIRDHPAYDENLGLMFDFFTVPQPYGWSPAGIDIDLDGDGIGMSSDSGEELAFKQAIYSYMTQFRAALPALKLIPNGIFSNVDQEMRQNIHGIYVEGSGDSWTGGVVAMMDPANDDGLAAIQADLIPGGYCVLEQAVWAQNGDDAFLAEDWSMYSLGQAMMLDDVYGIVQGFHQTVQPHQLPHWGDLYNWRGIGAPTGPMTEEPDSADVYKRDFEAGSIRIGPRAPFNVATPFFIQIFDANGDVIEGY